MGAVNINYSEGIAINALWGGSAITALLCDGRAANSHLCDGSLGQLNGGARAGLDDEGGSQVLASQVAATEQVPGTGQSQNKLHTQVRVTKQSSYRYMNVSAAKLSRYFRCHKQATGTWDTEKSKCTDEFMILVQRPNVSLKTGLPARKFCFFCRFQEPEHQIQDALSTGNWHNMTSSLTTGTRQPAHRHQMPRTQAPMPRIQTHRTQVAGTRCLEQRHQTQDALSTGTRWPAHRQLAQDTLHTGNQCNMPSTQSVQDAWHTHRQPAEDTQTTHATGARCPGYQLCLTSARWWPDSVAAVSERRQQRQPLPHSVAVKVVPWPWWRCPDPTSAVAAVVVVAQQFAESAAAAQQRSAGCWPRA